MLHKWKLILINWINCYFDEDTKNESVNSESLLTIISHLRENLNLDESKSSVLEAETVEEFLREKYPEFIFENGTIKPSDEELHVVASLLLYFVCVNSKDVDIKSAMCSKLSPEDQETIFKFSKCLMECSPITYRDVQAAITEACGQEIAAVERVVSNMVAETPPAVRSLHCEVRRLQAALDAERFDRNYLQEELSRTNLRLENLLKDKEQYKLDIVNLKAKISMCCGQEVEASAGDAEDDSSTTLMRQLLDTEERLLSTQEKLDDAQYERDTYKAKINELKRECEKLLSISQQESTRSSNLLEELDTERQHNHQLKELVAELRQHHQKNCLDSSQLECDDPDATMHSLHNVSVCSEACAMVIEVQLMEERNKVVALQQQIQDWQNQLTDLTQQTENEKSAFEAAMSEKDNDIFNLKHRINEEIEEKNTLKTNFNDELIKLNNEINELELKLKDANNNSTRIIEQKMQEIQTLQEEKLSLLQSLSDETTKLENIIKELESDKESEKASKLQMKEDYENQMMKLNEKVLNRNNELVELQNKVFEKGETIEQLQLDLRKEQESKEEISTKFLNDISKLNDEKHKLEQSFRQKFDESKELQKRLFQNVSVFEEFNKEIDELKAIQSSLEKTLDERNATIHSLKIQLADEIAYKTKLQNNLSELQQTKSDLSQEINLLNQEVSQLKKEIHEKDRNIYAIDLYLKEEKHLNKTLKDNCDKLGEDLNKLSQEICSKNKDIKGLQDTIESNSKLFEEEINKRDAIIEEINNKLASEEQLKVDLQKDLKSLELEKENLDKELTKKWEEMLQLQINYGKLNDEAEKNIGIIETLESKLSTEITKYCELEEHFNAMSSNFITQLEDAEDASKVNMIKYEQQENKIQTLNSEIEKMVIIIDENKDNLTKHAKENKELSQLLNEEISKRNKIEDEYQKKCSTLSDMNTRFDEKIAIKDDEINTLRTETESLVKTLLEKKEENKTLLENLQKEMKFAQELSYDKNAVITDLQKELDNLNSLIATSKSEWKQEISIQMQTIEALKKENEQLHFVIEEDNSNREFILKEKDKLIEKVEQKFNVLNIQMESLRKDYEDDTFVWEKTKLEMREIIESRDSQINLLEEQLEQTKMEAEHSKNDLNKQLDDFKREKQNTEIEMKERIVELLAEVNRYDRQLTEREHEIVDLQEKNDTEKFIRDSVETEKNQMKQQIEDVTMQLANGHLEIKSLREEINGLMSEKSSLTQELIEETSNRRLVEVEKQKLLEKVDKLNKNLDDLRASNDTLMKANETLGEQLSKESAAKELVLEQTKMFKIAKEVFDVQLGEEHKLRRNLEEQIEALMKEKNDLIQEINNLNIQVIEEASIKDSLQSERHKLIEMLEEERQIRGDIFNEKECLLDENEALKFSIMDLKSFQGFLENDKQALIEEKEALLKTLDEEKCARDELETEKNNISNNLQKYIYELNEKTTDVENIIMELNRFKADFKKHEEFNKEVFIILGSGIEHILEKINKEEDSNDILHMFTEVENCKSMSVIEQCDFIINLADTLSSELSLRKKLEAALKEENAALCELKQLITLKDNQITELQKQEQHLEHVIQESREEFTKHFEAQNEIIESKTRDIQKLQLDNQSLTNELNNVKFQLEVKVHSLKEKLVDNENLTDKLKKTYECQIDNLNEVVTKLTSYLKEKTIELDTIRKEKDRQMHTIEENNDVIKSLQEKVKSQNQNQEKLMHDFESERLVLKNMVTVTESVMEDQKISLNHVIAEHEKSIKTLQEQNKALQELITLERNNATQKLQEKEVAFATLFKEKAEVRNAKEQLEKQLEVNNANMMELKIDLEQKIYRLEELEIQNKSLEGEITKTKEDLTTLQDNYNVLKGLKDSLEFELIVAINNLSNDLKLECNKHDECFSALHDQLCANTTIKKKVQHVCKEVIFLVKLNYNLYNQRNDYINQLFIAKTKLVALEELSKDKDKLNNDNLHLINVIEENKNVISNLEQLIQHELEQNTKLREEAAYEKTLIENKCTLLEEQKLDIEKQLENKNGLISELESTVESVKMNISEYWKPKIQAYETETVSYKEDTEKLLENVNNLISKLNYYEQQLNEKSGALTKITQNNDEILKQLSVYELQLAENTDTISKMMAEKDKIMGELNILENDMKIKHELTNNLAKEKNAVINDLNIYKQQIIEKDRIMSEVLQEKDELLKKVDSRDELIKGKDNELSALSQENEDLAKELALCKQELDEKLDALTKMTAEQNEKAIKLQNCEQELSNTVELLAKLSEDKNVLVAQFEEYTKDAKEKENIIAVAKQEKDEAVTKINEYKQIINEKVELISKATNDLAETENKLNVCEHELLEKNCIISKYTEENKELLENLKSFESNLSEKEEFTSKLLLEKESLEKTLQKRAETIENMTIEISELVTKLNGYENVLQQKDEVITEAERERQEFATKLQNIEVELQENIISKVKQERDEITDKLTTYERELKEKGEEIVKITQERDEALKKLEDFENLLITKDEMIYKVNLDKDEIVGNLKKELDDEKNAKNKYLSELETKIAAVYELGQKLNDMNLEVQALESLKKENDELLKVVGQRDTFAVASVEKQYMKYTSQEKEGDHQQVSTPTSDLTQSSIESLKTITDLEKIIHDKNRTITTLQSDITYLKSLMADSENKLLDVTKALDMNKENCQQLSNQLKKIVQQKNEEIGDLKKQVSKMSVTENRATQIIKVSAKYQAIILKRIAEIKSNTILKELTNFGNTSNNDNELRRGLHSGAITMEDLENFLETTDRHLKRYSEKQIALQKERDRLIEVNRINESEILHLKKFLTELSVSVKTFDSVREVYTQKLSRVVSIQRTVRREILNLDGVITEATMCKLERGYAAVMQDLCECTMNLERWMDRCIGRTVSAEKIKQAFTSDHERMSLSTSSFQNTGLEVQLGELESSFQRLLEEAARAHTGDGAKDAPSLTVMEVRAEYEDKLNRMKAKMKQLYQEQIAVFKDKQKEEVAALERELQKALEKMAHSSIEYEKHIRALTTELWSVGEKYLMKNNEAEWLKKRQHTGSLMSLQHVHSSGISAPPEIISRPSDCHSLRSLPVHNPKEKRERGLHMSDEEGEVFDNRWLKELSSTPRRSLAPSQRMSELAPGQRMSELKWRNSLCPPHLKSSYPAETQFANTFDEDDIKCAATLGGKQRKEVGITAYKKPGPPTPSKQAGRLSATDCELRESLRVEGDPQPARKASTPSRIRSLFRSNKNDTTEGTPRSRRISNIFRKK